MGKRPAYCYTKISRPAYTRTSRRNKKSYVRGVPDPKITIFELGNRKREYPVHLHLVGKERCRIRHIALEAARIALNRYLTKNVGRENYHATIRVYPFDVLRNNKTLNFAGADRIQQGMKLSFGKPEGRAARVRVGQELITVRVDPQYVQAAKEAMRRAKYKFPTPCGIKIGKGEELMAAEARKAAKKK